MTQSFTELEKSLNYKFNNSSLLEEALSHPSLKQVNNSSKNYERLEFLGDSILGFLITEMLFTRFTNHNEGTLAKIKAYAVSRDTIVDIANSFNLADHIIMNKGEVKSGGRTNYNNIENTMEALIAAIYLDSGIDKVRKIVNRLWQKYIEDLDFNIIDPKTSLQEILQSQYHTPPTYEVIKQEGEAHAPTFTVQLSAGDKSQIGIGKSIKEAEKSAALAMLKKLKPS